MNHQTGPAISIATATGSEVHDISPTRSRLKIAVPVFCLTAIADSAVVRTQPCQKQKSVHRGDERFLKNDGGQGWIGDYFAIPRLRFATAQTICLTAIADSAVVRTQPCQKQKSVHRGDERFLKNDGGQGWIRTSVLNESRFTVCRL